ncbi:MAG: hypothetical protein M3O36_06130, partial [Myxococcota bacterium]|nr:hypothetical protein [Myxococcota bacterium]
TTLAEGQNLTGAPNPSGLGASTADEWRFSSHGFFRAPMRIGLGSRPKCQAGLAAGTAVDTSGNPVGANNKPLYSVPCAGPGQSSTALHTPFTPDNQYLDWRYIRQQEYDWTEVFLNYGNSRIQGTVSFQAFGFTDAEHFTTDNITSQLGIAQGWVTVKPDPGVVGLRLNWKVGAFWDKFGMAGKYDAGKYDTYLFGRTHQMGETFGGEYDVGDFTLRLSHGIGIHNEAAAYSAPSMSGGDPGFSLVHHLHAGVSYKKMIDFNAHYISAWSQDFRPDPKMMDGSITVTGAEARFTGGVAGELYLGYSHVSSDQPLRVGPILEVVGSLGGAGYSHAGGNGLVDNYFGCKGGCSGTAIPADHGTLDTIELQYDYSFGALYRKLTTGENFWGDGWDVNLSVFGMFTKVGSNLTPDQTNSSRMLGDGVSKLKYGADLIVVPLSWMGIGARADVVQPTDGDKEQSFWVVSPKLIFKTKFVTHEEITAQYSHYSYGKTVLAQPPNQGYPPDENTLGIKGTLWW